MMFFAVRLAFLATFCWVSVRGANLTIVNCVSSPCERTPLRMAFKLTGTPAGTPSGSVGFFRDGEGSAALCTVDRTNPCNSSASCGCTEASGERTYHYNIDSAVSSTHDGAWTAVIQNTNPSDVVRSPVCQVTVNDSCPYLTTDGCPSAMAIGSLFHLSYTRQRQFPSTAGTMLKFVVEGTTTEVVGTLNTSTCTASTLPTGCFDRDGNRVYYINVTADPKHEGNWMAVVDATPSSDTVRSDTCSGSVYDSSVIPSSTIAVIISAILIFVYLIVIFVLLVFISDGKKMRPKHKAIVALGGALIVLACVIALIVYSLAINVDDIKLFPDLYNANIAIVVIGFIAFLLGLAFGIVMLVRSLK